MRPRVVALGGGHGLSATLRALKRYAGDITAVVTVADDGGSSGRLREAFDVPAPGDIRRCLVALADPDDLWARTFEHRFDAGELAGHPVGNLVLTGLTAVTGDFVAALQAASKLLRIDAHVLPATTVPVVLKAQSPTGEVVGQVAAERTAGISVLHQVPPDAAPPQQVLDAIAAADQVVIGPGSLFTSVLAALLPAPTRQALAAADGRIVYVCNLATNAETLGFDVAAHVDALRAHGVTPDVVLYDPARLPLGEPRVAVVPARLAGDDPSSHDPVQLAAALEHLVG